MPQARKSARSSARKPAAFKQPAALNRLNQSLAAAQKAITELSKHTGRNAGKTTKSLHADVKKFVANAKRDSGKFSTALKRDFDQAQKTVASASSSATKGRKTTARKPAARKTTGRSTTTRKTAAKRTTRKSR